MSDLKRWANMQHSLLQLIFSEAGYLPLGLLCITLGIALFAAKTMRWSDYVWLPTFALSTGLSLPAIVGCAAGGYGGLIMLALWPFPIASILLWFARPDKPFSMRGAQGMIVALALAVILAFVQRPGCVDIKIRVVDSAGLGIPEVAIVGFVYHGAGPNRDFSIKTDASGLAILRAHWPEEGSITIRAGSKPSFQFQTASPKGGYQINYEGGHFGPSSETFVIPVKKEEPPNKAARAS